MGKTKSVEVQMSEILDSIKENVNDALEKAEEEAAQLTKSELRNSSPEKKGQYKTGWTIKRDRKNKIVTVYNSKYPGLTHLLENGHLIRNKRGEYGRAPAHKHIEPAAEKGIEEFTNKVENELNKL